MSIIEKFLTTIKENNNNIAIKTKQGSKTYSELYNDITKAIKMFEEKSIDKKSKVLLLINMSYEMYVAIFACVLYGVDVVIIDNFKDHKRVKKQLLDVNVDYVLVNNKTSLVKKIFKPIKKTPHLNIQKALKTNVTNHSFDISTNASLITFTSGGTGAPKAVRRSLEELELQLNKTVEIVGNLKEEYVLATLPIYALACIIEGIKIYIPSKKENLNEVLKKEENTVMFSSISNYLKLENITSLKRAFFGGSILYYVEARYIKRNLPNAHITYIYGATEASIISCTTLDEYITSLEENKLCLGNIVEGNKVMVDEEEIIVSKGIITNTYLNEEKTLFHPTKDLGYVENNKVYLVGRKINDSIRSNYLLEMIVKKGFNEIFPIAILNINGEHHIYLEEKDESKKIQIICILEQYIENGQIHIVNNLPLDYRHQAKIDYKKLLKIYNGDKNV